MYSEVDDSTSSGNVSQQVTRVFKDRDEFMISNNDNADVDNTVAPACINFRHTSNTIVRIAAYYGDSSSSNVYVRVRIKLKLVNTYE
jgi:hypothetical protein